MFDGFVNGCKVFIEFVFAIVNLVLFKLVYLDQSGPQGKLRLWGHVCDLYEGFILLLAISLDWQIFAMILFFTCYDYTWTLVAVKDFQFELLVYMIALRYWLDT